MKKKTKRFLFLTTAALAGMYAYNRFVANTSTNQKMVPTTPGSRAIYFTPSMAREVLFY